VIGGNLIPVLSDLVRMFAYVGVGPGVAGEEYFAQR
jgi:hypothetical protein